MLSADKQLLLSGFLGRLPPHVATRLAKAVEVDRLVGGTGLPHDEILRSLRPQLRVSPERVRMPTPLRFFCRPFEDLLTNAERQAKQKGRIARASIEPVWNWLANELMPERHRELTNAIRDAILSNHETGIESKSDELCAEAAAAMKAALTGEKNQATAAKQLGALTAADAAEIALLLGGAQQIGGLQKRLPKPIATLADSDIDFLRDLFGRLSDSDPELAPYVLIVVMGRLERPWEALGLTAALSGKSTDTLISNTDLSIAGELLFSDLDGYVKKIRAIRPMDFDSDALLANLAGFSELSSGMVKELSIRRDGKWGQRLTKDRGAVAEVLEGLLNRALKEIQAALPPARGGTGKGTKPLDLTRPPDPERVEKATRYAHLMVHCRPFAVAASFSAKLNETLEETGAALRSYAEDALRELRAATPENRVNMEANFTTLLDLCTLVLGEEETDLLRRRARVPASG